MDCNIEKINLFQFWWMDLLNIKILIYHANQIIEGSFVVQNQGRTCNAFFYLGLIWWQDDCFNRTQEQRHRWW